MKKLFPYWPVGMICGAMFAAWGAWGITVLNTSPFTSPEIAVPLFYATFFLAIFLSVATLIAVTVLTFSKKITIADATHDALRQGLIVALIVCGLMIFQQFRILSWPIAVMLVMMGVFLEAFFWQKN